MIISPRRIALVLVAAVAITGTAPAVAAQPQSADLRVVAGNPVGVTRARNTFSNLPVRGKLLNQRVFRGLLDVTNFRARGGELYAIGRLSGRILNADGDVLRRLSDVRVRLPVSFPQASISAQGAACDILTLQLGPLHLDLLGLVIDLNRINLRITADPGPGNLLGNLLCAVAGLLDPQAPAGVLAQLLRAVRFIVDNL
jgi:hypothetical protein